MGKLEIENAARLSGEPEIVTLQQTLYTSRNPTRRWLHLARHARVRDMIEKNSPPRRSLALEIGPGSGVYLPTLCGLFDHVKAIDIQPAHIDAIRKRFQTDNLTLIAGDFLAQKWENAFDLILCSEVIEHIKNPDQFIKAISYALRPAGLLIVSTPQRWSLMEITCRIGLSPFFISMVRSIYKEPVLPTGHISLLSRKTLVSKLCRNGFSILESDVFGLYVPLLAEFGGHIGARFAQMLEPKVQRSPVSFLLWTQLHLATRSVS